MNEVSLRQLREHITPHENHELNEAFERVSESVRIHGLVDPVAKMRMDMIFAIAEIRYLNTNERF